MDGHFTNTAYSCGRDTPPSNLLREYSVLQDLAAPPESGKYPKISASETRLAHAWYANLDAKPLHLGRDFNTRPTFM